MRIETGPGELRFTAYDYPPASVYPSGAVRVCDIRDADPESAPPEVRLMTGETLFVSAEHRQDLRRFCEEHGIPTVSRPDLWGAILEPFVDTEFTAADDERTRALLSCFGLTVREIVEIRDRFAPTMAAYNIESMLWDWVHLGLADLLDALRGRLAGAAHALPPAEFAEVYEWAIALADRSKDASMPR